MSGRGGVASCSVQALNCVGSEADDEVGGAGWARLTYDSLGKDACSEERNVLSLGGHGADDGCVERS